MVQSSYKQHLRVVESPTLSPALLNASSGQIGVGTGNLANFSVPKPTYAQFLPAPTNYAVENGKAMVGMIEQVGTIANQLAENESTFKANQLIAAATDKIDEFMVKGPDGNGGVLTLKNINYLDSYDTHLQIIRDQIDQQAKQIAEDSPAVAAKFLAGMETKFTQVKKQARTKYLTEYGSAHKTSVDMAVKQDVNLALQSQSPQEAIADLSVAISRRTEFNQMVSQGQVEKGVKDQSAVDAVIKEYIDGTMGNANPSGTLSTMMPWIRQNASKELQAYAVNKSGDILKDKATRAKAINTLNNLYAEDQVKGAATDFIKGIKATEQKLGRKLSTTETKEVAIEEQKKLAALYPSKAIAFGNMVSVFTQGTTNTTGKALVEHMVTHGGTLSEVVGHAAEVGATFSSTDYSRLIALNNVEVSQHTKLAMSQLDTVMSETYDVEVGMDLSGRAMITSAVDGKNVSALAEARTQMALDVSAAAGKSQEDVQKVVAEWTDKLRDVNAPLARSQKLRTGYFTSTDENDIALALSPDFKEKSYQNAMMPDQFSPALFSRLKNVVPSEGYSPSFADLKATAEVNDMTPAQVFSIRFSVAEAKRAEQTYGKGTAAYWAALKRIMQRKHHLENLRTE